MPQAKLMTLCADCAAIMVNRNKVKAVHEATTELKASCERCKKTEGLCRYIVQSKK